MPFWFIICIHALNGAIFAVLSYLYFVLPLFGITKEKSQKKSEEALVLFFCATIYLIAIFIFNIYTMKESWYGLVVIVEAMATMGILVMVYIQNTNRLKKETIEERKNALLTVRRSVVLLFVLVVIFNLFTLTQLKVLQITLPTPMLNIG